MRTLVTSWPPWPRASSNDGFATHLPYRPMGSLAKVMGRIEWTTGNSPYRRTNRMVYKFTKVQVQTFYRPCRRYPTRTKRNPVMLDPVRVGRSKGGEIPFGPILNLNLNFKPNFLTLSNHTFTSQWFCLDQFLTFIKQYYSSNFPSI